MTWLYEVSSPAYNIPLLVLYAKGIEKRPQCFIFIVCRYMTEREKLVH